MWKFHSYFAILLLSAIATQAASRSFQFVDVRGHCWQCSSDFKCQRCFSGTLARLNLECLPPSQFDCMISGNLNFRHPSRDQPFYYVCTPDHGFERRQCRCDRVFDFNRQCCVYPEYMITPEDLCIYDDTNIRGPIQCTDDETTTTRPNKPLCLPPTEEECCGKPPGFRFPSNDLTFYYQCELDSSQIVYRTMRCPCDQLFDYDLQSCVDSDLLGRIVCERPTNVEPLPCNPEEETTPAPPDETTTWTEDVFPTVTATKDVFPTLTYDPTETTTVKTTTEMNVTDPVDFPTLPTNTPPTTTTTQAQTTTKTKTTSTAKAIFPTVTEELTTSKTTTDKNNGSDNEEKTTKAPPCVCIPWMICRCPPCWRLPWACHMCIGVDCWVEMN